MNIEIYAEIDEQRLWTSSSETSTLRRKNWIPLALRIIILSINNPTLMAQHKSLKGCLVIWLSYQMKAPKEHQSIRNIRWEVSKYNHMSILLQYLQEGGLSSWNREVFFAHTFSSTCDSLKEKKEEVKENLLPMRSSQSKLAGPSPAFAPFPVSLLPKTSTIKCIQKR